MPSVRITKTAIAALKPGKRDLYLWDSDVPGFGIKVTPAGGRTYLFQYRDKLRRTRRVTIGRDGSAWTPEKARKAADAYYRQVRGGGDPARDKSQSKKASTFRDAVELFLSGHMESKRKKGTAAEYRRILEKYALPALGSSAVADIKRADVSRLHIKMESSPYQANRTLAALSSLFSWAIRNGHYTGENPCRYIEKWPEGKRERFLSPRELTAIGSFLEDTEAADPVAVGALRFLLLTGMRKNEVLRLTWDEVDADEGCLRLKDSKTGAKSIPLGAPALEVLNRAAEYRRDKNPYVFPGLKPDGNLVGLQKIWQRWREKITLRIWSEDPAASAVVDRLKRQKATDDTFVLTTKAVKAEAKKEGIKLRGGVLDVRLHDFRHSFASVGASAGDSLVILGSLLGHSTPATTARYAHLYDDPRKAAAERISERIAAGMTGRAARVVGMLKGFK